MARDLTSEERGCLDSHTLGVVEGLAMYAWWKDGTCYVGTAGTTLQAATVRVLRDRSYPSIAAALEART